VRRHPRRVVFAEGEEEQVMRAAVSYVNQRLGTAFLLGREERSAKPPSLPASISTGPASSWSMRACPTATVEAYAEYLYSRLQRKGITCSAIASA
jgi:malate dehydrogenase (oxaloacetate-decarboxylating)(NADP+)